ncbi:MAG: AraC family transcriptional regulator [Pseudomonadota bacterium]
MTQLKPLTDRKQTRVARTLWRIEAGLYGPLSLTALAEVEGISPFHLSRAFALSVGRSPMAYVKARRLSEAALTLRNTDTKVVEIAFAAGFETHEGFSRSFRAAFGYAPSEVRRNPDLSLDLQEAIVMASTDQPKLDPAFVTRPEQRLVGLSRRFTMATRNQVPQFWQEAAAEIGQAMYGVETFGATYDFEGEAFTYMVAIADDGRIDTEHLNHLVLPAGDYAVFSHEGHISTIGDTWSAIFDAWASSADVTFADGPEFEHYAADFSLEAPGGVSICIPIKRAG